MIPDDLSLLDVKKQHSPDAFARFLHAQGDVFWWPAARFFVVTRHETAREVVTNPAFSADRSSFFISRMPQLDLRLIADFFGIVQKMMVMSDGDAHSKRRKAAALGIDGELIDHYRPVIEKTVGSLLQSAAASGGFDFAKDVAEVLPFTVLADLFCIPSEDREQFYAWSLQMTQFFGGATQYHNEDGLRVNTSALHLRHYFQELIEKRRRQPQLDFTSVLLANQERFHLSDDEIISQAIMMLVAGQVTTTDQLNNNMFTLLSTHSLPALQAQPELLPLAIEEFNRLDPGVTFLFRTVQQPITLQGVALQAEDVVFVANHAVNRDEAIFSDPYACQLDRKKNPHFAYGHGPHFCLGARLARLQMQSCFQQLLTQFPRLRLIPSARQSAITMLSLSLAFARCRFWCELLGIGFPNGEHAEK